MASEEEFPIELEIDKLEIGPMLQTIKFLDEDNLPVTLNPFYSEIVKENSSNQHDMVFKYSSTCPKNKKRIERRTFRKCNQFKKTVSNSTAACLSQVILREPVLKIFQQCLHPKNRIQTKLQSASFEADNKCNEESNEPISCSTIKTLNLNESSDINPKINEANKTTLDNNNVTDFRKLIEECQTLLETNVSFKTERSKNHNQKNSKTFNTIQTPKARSSQESIESIDASCIGTSSTISLTPRIRGEQFSHTSCSQQARINTSNQSTEPIQQSNAGTSSCDVTIDELACYFETLVHIPKKMSTMAESMYI